MSLAIDDDGSITNLLKSKLAFSTPANYRRYANRWLVMFDCAFDTPVDDPLFNNPLDLLFVSMVITMAENIGFWVLFARTWSNLILPC